MTEKRYSVEFVKEMTPVYDRKAQKHLNCFELDDLLQGMHERNDKLEKEVLSLRRQLTVYRKIKRLVNEND